MITQKIQGIWPKLTIFIFYGLLILYVLTGPHHYSKYTSSAECIDQTDTLLAIHVDHKAIRVQMV